jgi:putative O-methyltransferase
MSSSGERINYSLRTAKAVERRMIVSSVKEIMKTNTKKYRYIGFGSFYFTDFKLFHRELHIDSMISVEGKKSLEKRVKFNRPYKCIDIEIGLSNVVLPGLSWSNEIKDFVWLDYDGRLHPSMFNDVQVFFSRASVGSIYLMSCNKQFPENYTKEKADEEFGELIPFGSTNLDFNGENDHKTIRKMFLLEIKNVIDNRNLAILDPNQKLVFKQLYYFTYRDGAPMISFGGLIDTVGNAFTLEKYNLDSFEFIVENDVFFNIAPPNITNKEYYFLNKFLPSDEANFVKIRGIDFIKEEDLKKYRNLYKYLPYYMDVVH